MRDIFHRLELTVVSPSQPTLDLWKARSAYPTRGEVVLPRDGASSTTDRELAALFAQSPQAAESGQTQANAPSPSVGAGPRCVPGVVAGRRGCREHGGGAR